MSNWKSDSPRRRIHTGSEVFQRSALCVRVTTLNVAVLGNSLHTRIKVGFCFGPSSGRESMNSATAAGSKLSTSPTGITDA